MQVANCLHSESIGLEIEVEKSLLNTNFQDNKSGPNFYKLLAGWPMYLALTITIL